MRQALVAAFDAAKGRKEELAGGMPTARSLHLPVDCHARLPPNLITRSSSIRTDRGHGVFAYEDMLMRASIAYRSEGSAPHCSSIRRRGFWEGQMTVL